MMALILVVDDELDAGRLLERVLTASGHRVVALAERDQALLWLQSRTPDLVLLDIKIRGGSGMSVLQHLHEHLPETKVIIITGHPSVETRSKAQQYGVKEYWAKPIELDELEKRVNELLKLDFPQQSQ
jgi:DNA-binding NtrC family response regulator